MAAALATGRRQPCRLCFHGQKDSDNTVLLIGVLEQLKAFYAGQQVVLLGDGLGRTGATSCSTGWRASRTGSTSSGCRPTPPELNPVEGLWANLKGVELANFAGDTVVQVADQAQHGIKRVCASEELVVGLLATPALRSTSSRHPDAENSNRPRSCHSRLAGPVAFACLDPVPVTVLRPP
jgi:hypothetical protein